MNAQALKIVQEDCQRVLSGREGQLKRLRQSSIFITGGTGFMGTWLAELLACLNDHYSFAIKVYLLSRSPDRFAERCAHLANRADLKLVHGDVRYLSELPKDTSFIVHAAGSPDGRQHASYPAETLMTAAAGTHSVLRAAERCSDFRMFLNVSSGYVEGEVKPGSLSDIYAESKRFTESLCSAARSQYRIPTLSVRPFAFLGPYQSLETPWAINNFLRDAITGRTIRVLGDGQTVRSYMYASDMAFWILAILAEGRQGAVYNLGSPEPIRLAELAELVAERVKPRPDVLLRAGSPADQQASRFVPDVSAAARDLGLACTVALAEALERTLSWNRA